MITTWLIMGVFAIIAFFFFIVELEECGIFSIIAIIITALIGFWAVPENANYQIQIKKITPTEVVKSSTTVYVEFKDFDNESYTEKKDYDNIDSNTTFYQYSYYDKFGELNSTHIYLNLSELSDSIYVEKGIVDYD